MKISIVIPVYNGSKTIARLVEELESCLSPGYEPEIILVNDASHDNSAQICARLADEHRGTVKFIDLMRNFGEHAAVMAGLNYAAGQYTVIIDDDFQNPPSEIIKMIDKIKEGYDVVYTKYRDNKYPFFKRLGSVFNDRVANIMLKKPRDLYLSSFKVMNSLVRQNVTDYKGPFPYIDGIILNITRNIASVEVEHGETAKERSGYTFRKLIGLWSNMFTNFSIVPLRIATYLGLLFSFIGFAFGLSIVIERLFFEYVPRGYATITVSILIFSGIQLFALGMIGEYIGRLFLSHNRLPQFIIKDKKGFNEK